MYDAIAEHLAEDPDCCEGCKACSHECLSCSGCQRDCECYKHGNDYEGP